MPLYRDKISQKATLLDSWQKDNKGYYAFFDGYFEKEKIRLEKKKKLAENTQRGRMEKLGILSNKTFARLFDEENRLIFEVSL